MVKSLLITMQDLEQRLRELLERLQEVPKTNQERVYLESLIIQLVSAQQIINRVEKAYKNLEPLYTLLNTGDKIELLNWLEHNPLPKCTIMSSIKELNIPEGIYKACEEILKTTDHETPIEAWAFLQGAFLSQGSDDPQTFCWLAAVRALTQTKEVLNASNPK